MSSIGTPIPAKKGRLVLTGAAGVLGSALLPTLAQAGYHILATDRCAQPAGIALMPEGTSVTWQFCDLADAAHVLNLLKGADRVLHLGGISVESPFAGILQSNIVGSHNLYEAARKNGVRRIVFASSNHVVGTQRQGQRVDVADPPRPDGNYGLSKLFGEGLASLYWHRFGIESVCLRIGSATPTPQDRRALSTWISPRDLAKLVLCALTAPQVGHLTASGISATTRRWWHSDAAWQQLGYAPQDNAEAFAPQVEHLLLPQGPQREMQGGSFLGSGPFD